MIEDEELVYTEMVLDSRQRNINRLTLAGHTAAARGVDLHRMWRFMCAPQRTSVLFCGEWAGIDPALEYERCLATVKGTDAEGTDADDAGTDDDFVDTDLCELPPGIRPQGDSGL